MLRSLFSGVSGLRAHQTMMDVIGDNIANINTAGFKSSSVQFADSMSQAMEAGAAASADFGGTNAEQIGLGVRVSGISINDTQGPTQNTGVPSDVAISGNGYFCVRSGVETLFTRAGSFNFDNVGNIDDPTGAVVQGWLADPVSGVVNTNGPAMDLKVPLGQSTPPTITTSVTFGGNLSSDAAVGDTVETAVGVVDSLGQETRVSLTFTKTADGAWTCEAKDPSGTSLGTQNLTFGANGAVSSTGPYAFTLPGAGGASPTTFDLDFGTPTQPQSLTQFGGRSDLELLKQDGAVTGYMRSFAVGADGTISGVFSNGKVKTLGQLAVAQFTNPSGLVKAGDSHFRVSASSGPASVNTPGAGGRGSIVGGALEGSNVDLSQEFTNLMIAERGFQANSRVITTADDMLQELVNLKH